jgi:hypothetical protein
MDLTYNFNLSKLPMDLTVDFDLSKQLGLSGERISTTLKNVTISVDGTTFFAAEMQEVPSEKKRRESIYIVPYRWRGPEEVDQLAKRLAAFTAFETTFRRVFGKMPEMSSGMNDKGLEGKEWWYIIHDATPEQKAWIETALKCGLILDYSIR